MDSVFLGGLHDFPVNRCQQFLLAWNLFDVARFSRQTERKGTQRWWRERTEKFDFDFLMPIQTVARKRMQHLPRPSVSAPNETASSLLVTPTLHTAKDRSLAARRAIQRCVHLDAKRHKLQ